MTSPQSLSTPASVRCDRRRRRAALVALVRDLFTVDELRRMVRDHPDGPEVLGEVPEAARPNDVYEEVVAAFDRRGVDQELFDVLIERRPRRAAEVAAVAALWGVEVRSP